MTQHTDPLVALERILSPHCRVTRLSAGALISDWRRTRFLGMTTADVRTLAGRDCAERAELVTGLVRAGCATTRRTAYTDAEVRRRLRAVHLLIRTLGFGRVLRLLPLAAPAYARTDLPSPADVARLKSTVEAHGRSSWLVNDDCKTEAVTAFILLRRRGAGAVLHVGVREHPFALHAWTSTAGLCIPDAEPGGHPFAPVLSIGG
ncbi:hypothetical protein GCM10018980_34250 [Streptomyces capoamus]|uniref:Microcin J25-processing protein McjB C-terminal domain-containing protein n=1 Tax=Streptomyces capoamus TaxID=68183 RepID=A0A919EWJ5_9ACTN|nr:lasso peptide biosynthesis B2 protein [Streptomyces capoamus]GGW10319.1 hypothetical protein GCM10010501_04870 [Streptomyces libani subsp. rufus]GHG51551.1 hypothetical protein GCM10018980_34250 [Streptomyces capoamus]